MSNHLLDLTALPSATIPDSVHRQLESGELRIEGRRIVRVVQAVENPFTSRAQSLLIAVQTEDDRDVRLFLKSGRVGEATAVGDPWGVEYEAQLYEGPLARSAQYRSPFVGQSQDQDRCWLVLRWLEGSIRVAKTKPPASMINAASWLGRFHREATKHELPRAFQSLLVPYGTTIERWATHSADRLVSRAAKDPRVHAALDRVPSVLALLTETPPTLIHGDFYPSNVLIIDEGVVPVDWEWSGSGPGEIDLRALIDGWPEWVRLACMDAYRSARWGSNDDRGPLDTGFEARVEAAGVFLALRLIGARSRAADQIWDGWWDAVVEGCERASRLAEAGVDGALR